MDTNVFIRYLTNDDPVKAEACQQLFQKAERNEIELTTTEAVITEVVYVLASKVTYNLSSQEIRARLYPLLGLPGLRLAHREIYLRALDLHSIHKLDFEDALIIAQMERQKISDLYSYDKDFDKIAGITRHEP